MIMPYLMPKGSLFAVVILYSTLDCCLSFSIYSAVRHHGAIPLSRFCNIAERSRVSDRIKSNPSRHHFRIKSPCAASNSDSPKYEISSEDIGRASAVPATKHSIPLEKVKWSNNNKVPEDESQMLEIWTQQLISEKLPGQILENEIGAWLQEVRFAMKAWSRQRSKAGAVAIEMLLKRIIDERRAGNERAQPSTLIYNSVLHGWAMSGAPGAAQRAEQIFSLMLSSSDVAPNVKSYNTLIHAWARSSEPGAAHRAEFILDSMENNGTLKPNTISYNTVLSAWARSNDIDAPARAEKILNRMQKMRESGENVAPDARSYTALIKAIARCGDPSYAVRKAEEILKNMKDLYAQGDIQVKPSMFTYAMVIHILSRSSEPGAAQRALSVLEEMMSLKDNDVKPNAIIFNSVIHAFARSREPTSAQKAEHVLNRMEEMREGDVRPNAQSYIQVIEGYSRSDEEDGAVRAAQVHARMIQFYREGNVDAKPTAESFNEVIEAWAYKGNPKMAEQTFFEMEQMYKEGNLDCKPNTDSFAALMDAWGTTSGEDDGPCRADKLLLSIEEQYDGGNLDVRPDLRCYTSVIEALARSGMDASAQRAEEVLLRMIQRYEQRGEVKPDARCFSTVIDGFSRSGETGACYKAERLLKMMDSMDVNTDVFSFCTVIGALSRSGEVGAAEKAEEILYRMEELSDGGKIELRPNIITYTGVIKAWSKSRAKGAAQKAENILYRMMKLYDAGRCDARVDAICFTTVINAWSKSNERGAARRAEKLLRLMETLYEEGNPSLKPDSFAYNTMIAAWSWEADDQGAKRAEEYLDAMEESYLAGDESMKPSTFSYNLVIHGYCERFHPQKAEELLNRMEKLYKLGRDDVYPNVKTFSPLIKSYAATNTLEGAEGAERVLLKMISLFDTDLEAEVKPTAQLFNAVITSWAKLGSSDALARAEQVLDKMFEVLDGDEDDLKTQLFSLATVSNAYSRLPDRIIGAQKAADILSRMIELDGSGLVGSIPFSIAFSSVINAYSRSGAPTSGKKIECILEKMEKMQDTSDVCATTVNYNYAIHAYTKFREPGAADRGEAILHRMEGRFRHGCKTARPNIVSYNMVLNAWAREASATWSKGGTDAAVRSLNLLERMEHYNVQPDIRSYTACINSLSRSGGNGCPQIAEKLLDRIENLYKAGSSSLRPDCKLYTAVINCWAHSNEPEKASHAHRLLHRMLDAYRAGNLCTKPDVYAYNSVILACAFSKGSSEERRKALRIAYRTFRKIKVSDTGKPDDFAYSRFLKACNNLLPSDDASRTKIVDAVFRRCCEDGQVSFTVLREMQRAPPSSARITKLKIPQAWSRNVRLKDMK